MTWRGKGAWVLAFDGIVADTSVLRARALADAFAAEGVDVDDTHLGDALCGRSFGEAARLVAQLRPGLDAHDIDETLVDLVALRAARHATSRFSMGVSLLPDARAWIVAQGTAGGRIAVRADSSRSDVMHLLGLAGLEQHVGLLVCTDDARTATSATLDWSWAQLDRRLHALGSAADTRTAIEPCARAAAVAGRYASTILRALA